MTAAQLVKRNWDEVRVEAYPDLRIAPGTLILLYGTPTAGKSTMLAKALDSMHGPVVLAALEEGAGPATSDRLSWLGIQRRNFYVFGRGPMDALVELVRRVEAVALGVDSIQVTTITPEQARALSNDGLAVWIVSQITKAGVDAGPAGTMRWPHEVDVTIRVDDGKWTLEKSRFQEVGIGGTV